MFRHQVVLFIGTILFGILSWTRVSAAHSPMYGRWGFDEQGEDTQTKPGDDFFQFANGAWIDKTPIPSDKDGESLRRQAAARTTEQLHELIETAALRADHEPMTLPGKVGAYYKAFMDERRIDRIGISAISQELAAVKGARTHSAIAKLMGRTTADFEGAIYGITLDVDLKNQSRYAVYLSQAGLGLPDRDYYLNSEFRSQKTQYQAYVAKLLQLAGWPNPEASAEHVVKFETKIAEVSWTKTQDRDLSASYNLMSVDELTQMAPPFDWHMFLEAAGLRTVNRIVVAEKGAFPEIARIYELTDVRTLQSWQAFHVIDNAAFYLSKPFTDAYFELHDKVLAGQEDQQIRWKRGVHAVSGGDCTSSGSRFDCFGDLGWAVGQLYTAKYFPPEAKTTIEALVANVKAAFRGRIANLDWMSEQTKTEAIRKLDTYTLKVGYPDHPRDYSNVVIRDDDAIGNARRAGAANWRFYVNRLGGPVDRTDWTMTPQTNDAYQGSLRDIAFPVAFLQPPIFDPDADDAINYGAIGGAIGHELTHGFDDEGRKIDADGTLRDWWTREDAETYKARADRLGQQYNQYEPIAGVHINGDLTMGENIADLGGLTLAIDSYRSSLHGSPSPVIDRVSGDQRVLLGWAQAWRGKERDETIRQELASEPYSPAKFRVNGVVRNLDGWYEAFHIAPTDKLYLKPEQRVHIW